MLIIQTIRATAVTSQTNAILVNLCAFPVGYVKSGTHSHLIVDRLEYITLLEHLRRQLYELFLKCHCY